MERVANFSQWINPWSKPEILEESTADKVFYAAKNVAIAAVGGIATAGVLYVAGCGLAQLGIALGSAAEGSFLALPQAYTSEALLQVGLWISWLGEKLFLTIAVPIYGIGYVFPRWFITQGIPQLYELVRQVVSSAFQFLRESVIQPAVDFVVKVITRLPQVLCDIASAVDAVRIAIGKTARYIVREIIQPALELAFRAIKFVGRTLLTCEEYIVNAIQLISTNILKPIVDVAVNALYSVANAFNDVWRYLDCAIEFAVTKIIQPMLSCVMDTIKSFSAATQAVMKWVFNKIVSNIFKLVDQTFQMVWGYLVQGLTYIGKELIVPALWSAGRMAGRAWEITGGATRWIVNQALIPALRIVADVITQLWQQMQHAMQWAISTILSPVLQVAANAVAHVWGYIASTGSAVANYVYQGVTLLINAMQWTASGLFSAVRYIANQILFVLQGGFLAARRTWQWVAENITNPVVNKVNDVADWVLRIVHRSGGLVSQVAYECLNAIAAGFQLSLDAMTSLTLKVADGIEVTLNALLSLQELILRTLRELGQALSSRLAFS